VIHQPLWSGTHVIAVGGTGVAYEPDTDSWFELPPEPGDAAARDTVPVVWAGDRVLIWSGLHGESSTPLDDGVMFVPTRPNDS
jgi:hypothetical protein